MRSRTRTGTVGIARLLCARSVVATVSSARASEGTEAPKTPSARTNADGLAGHGGACTAASEEQAAAEAEEKSGDYAGCAVSRIQ